MHTNEPGREPTDAELICNYAEAAERRRAAFCVATRREHDVAVESLLDRAEKYLSGQRPMPDTPAPDEVAQLRAEVARLKDWKESAISVDPPRQEIGKLLGVKLGDSVHDKILPGITALTARAAALDAGLRMFLKAGVGNSADLQLQLEAVANAGMLLRSTPGKEPTSE